jgi:hypothetical protein
VNELQRAGARRAPAVRRRIANRRGNQHRRVAITDYIDAAVITIVLAEEGTLVAISDTARLLA